MKIYEKEPPYLIRLQIIKQECETEYLTLIDATLEQVEQMIKEVMNKQVVPALETGFKEKVTSVNIRESKGGKNGKSLVVSFRGIDPKKALGLIINHLNIHKND